MEPLAQRPTAWRLFAALRHLEQRGRAQGRAPLGYDGPPSEEAARLRGDPSLAFPVGEVRDVRGLEEGAQPELRTPVLGFLGAVGVLPQHYTELALRRLHKHKDRSLVDWLDLLLHRTLSYYWRAWRRQRPLYSFEHAALHPGRPDPAGLALRGLAAIAGRGLERRQSLPDAALLAAAGLFADPRRSAAGLAALVAAWLRQPTRIRQFVPRWLPIEAEDRTRLASRARPEGSHARLGQSSFLGSRVRDVTSLVHLEVGPIGGDQYGALLPGTPGHRALRELVRTYLGIGIDARLELRFDRERLPPARLARGGGRGEAERGARLGRDSWLGEPRRAPRVRNAVFPLATGWAGG